MKTKCLFLLLLILSSYTHAQVLRVEGDLIVKPSEDWNDGVSRIDLTPGSQMADMSFAAPPYNAKWTNVQASLISGLQIKTEQQAGGVVAVQINWDRPGILIFNMDMPFGRCFGVNWRLPEGGWQAEGHMTYDFAQKKLVWIDFSFLNNATGDATVNLGDCSFSGENLNMLTEHLLAQARNPDWMRGLVQETVLKWATVSFASGKNRLLDPITVQLTECTSLTWEPTEIRDLPNGMWRVPGRLVFDTSDDRPKYDFGTLRRSEDESTLNGLTTSQFVLPLNAMEQIAAALARNRGFFSRTLASAMPSFTSLFGSRKIQNYEWSDLWKLPLHPQIAFDVTVYGPVTLGDRRSVPGYGMDYSAKTSLAIHSHLFTLGDWYPYFDFRSVESGRTRLDIYDGLLHVRMTFSAIHLRSYLRDEFAQVRSADDFTNMTLMNQRFDKFFDNRWFHAELPRWRVGEWELIGAALTASPKSLRVPLALKPMN